MPLRLMTHNRDRAADLVACEVRALIRDHGAYGSADAIDRVRRNFLMMLNEGERTAPVDVMILDELTRHAGEIRKSRRH